MYQVIILEADFGLLRLLLVADIGLMYNKSQ